MSSNTAAEVPAIDAALAAANVMMRVAARSVLEVEDIVSTPQLRVLMLIAGAGPQTLGAVATELGVHPSNATRTCEKLVQAGLIVRSDHPADRRYLQLALTADGSALVEHVLDQRRSAMADVFSAMPEDDRRAVAGAFERFAAAAGGEPITDGRFAFGLGR
ncbi:MAG: MarR family transcriptional regulator [Leifsonia sp.]